MPFRATFIKIFRKIANEGVGQELETPKKEIKRFYFLL